MSWGKKRTALFHTHIWEKLSFFNTPARVFARLCTNRVKLGGAGRASLSMMSFLAAVDCAKLDNASVLIVTFVLSLLYFRCYVTTLPKALRTQALTALTSNFGLVGMLYFSRLVRLCLIWFGRFGLF